MTRFEKAMFLFGGLAQQVNHWQAMLPREEAQAKLKEHFLSLDDEGFEMLCDLVEMMETEPGRRLTGGELHFGAINQFLLEVKVIRERKVAQ